MSHYHIQHQPNHHRSSSSHGRHHRRSSSSSSSSSSAAALPPPDEQIYIEIWFLDNSSKSFLVAASIKEHELTHLICTKLGFTTPEKEGYFCGLVESYNGSTLDRPLPKEEGVGLMSWQWQKEEAPNKLVFVIKLHYETVLGSGDKVVRYYNYIQAVHQVVTGILPLSPTMAIRLACLQFRAKFGDSCDAFRVDFLGNRIVEFIPQPLLRTRKASDWNKAMLSLFQQEPHLKTLTEEDARSLYLTFIQRHPYFGSTLYKVIQNPSTAQATDVMLAVNRVGIQIFPLPSSFPPLEGEDDVAKAVPGPLVSYTLLEMLRWGYVPQALFYMSLRIEEGEDDEHEQGKEGREKQEVVNFGTGVGQGICDVMTLYAFGFIKNAEFVEEGGEKEGVVGVEGGGGGEEGDRKEKEMP